MKGLYVECFPSPDRKNSKCILHLGRSATPCILSQVSKASPLDSPMARGQFEVAEGLINNLINVLIRYQLRY